VVIIANDLNKELDKYISSRRDTDMWSFFSPRPRKPKVKAEVPDGLATGEVRVLEDEEPGFWTRLFRREREPVSEDLSPEEMARLEAMQAGMEEIDELEEEHPEAMEELEMERESLLERFFALFRGSGRRHRLERKAAELEYVEDEVIPRIDEEVKGVLKAIHPWLERLPPEEKKAFKKSNDFQVYRALLQKYGIAKSAAKQPAKPAQPEKPSQPAKEAPAALPMADDKDYPDIRKLQQ